MSAGGGSYTIEGFCDALVTTIRKKAAPVRIGIDIGGTDTRIGLVDIHQKIIVCESMKTDASRSPEEIILVKGAKRSTGKSLSPQEIFDGAQKGDPALKEVVDMYIRRLGTGIVNIVNIFRPQLVLLGGVLSEQGEMFTLPLYDIMKEGCFGGDKGELPEIEMAALGNKAGMVGAASLI